MKLICGDSLQKLKDLPTNTIDAICTDPPYGWRFMGKAWDGADIERVAKAKERGGMMADGKIRKPRDLPAESAGTYDTSSSGNQSFMFWTSDWAREALRVLKPGGHMLVFCGPRTYHAMAMGVEMAGFEIRDQLQWLFGSGFPKSLDVSKAIDKAAGVAVEKGEAFNVVGGTDASNGGSKFRSDHPDYKPFAPATDDAKRWQGWGTALKPANEPIVLARKPLEKGLTVAQNVQKWGTGALNVDGTRIATVGDDKLTPRNNKIGDNGWKNSSGGYIEPSPLGRWPANVLFDEEAAEMLDEQSGTLTSGKPSGTKKTSGFSGGLGEIPVTGFGDSGGASRFFYCAKTSKRERNAGLEDGKNGHPTVKPIKLMEYLCKLVCPPGGIVLDPFMGSGTTGCAAVKLGFQFIGIEREQEYIRIAKRRIEYWQEALEDEQLPLPLAKDANEPS